MHRAYCRDADAGALLRRVYRIQRWEFWLSIACFVGVVLFGLIPGLGIAVAVAIIEFL